MVRLDCRSALRFGQIQTISELNLCSKIKTLLRNVRIFLNLHYFEEQGRDQTKQTGKEKLFKLADTARNCWKMMLRQ